MRKCLFLLATLATLALLAPALQAQTDTAQVPRTQLKNGRFTPVYGPFYSWMVLEQGNLYFTNARARAAVSALAPVSYDASSGVFSLTGLSTLGTANQVPGMNAGATGLEWKTLAGGAIVSVTHGVGTLTIGISANSITAAELATGSVLSAEIADSTIVGADVALGHFVRSINGLKDGIIFIGLDGAVITTADGPTFDTVKVQAAGGGGGGVSAVQSPGGTITVGSPTGPTVNVDVANDGITAAKIANDAVGSTEIATDAVGAAEIVADAVGSSEIATDAVGSAEIGADQVGSSEIATDAVGALEIAADAVGTSEIAADAVTASEIATDAVNSAEIIADAVGAAEIAADAVGSSEIAAGAVGTSEIADGTVAAADLAASGVTATSYGSATQVPQVTFNAAGQATSAANVPIAITGSSVNDGSLTGADIQNSSLNDQDIDTVTTNGMATTWAALHITREATFTSDTLAIYLPGITSSWAVQAWFKGKPPFTAAFGGWCVTDTAYITGSATPLTGVTVVYRAEPKN